NFERDGPQSASVLERANVEAFLGISKRYQIERSKITGRVVEEHVFRARIGSADWARLWASVPIVDSGVKLDAGIGRSPCGVSDLVPQIASLYRLDCLAR